MITKQSPLQAMSVVNIVTVSIRELAGLHMLDLRVKPATSSHAAVAEALRIDLDATPGKCSRIETNDSGESHLLCLAPDWWLLVASVEVEEKFSPLRLNAGYLFSAVNVTGQRTTIELQGPNAREVLGHLWEQDLREKSFPVGSVSQGLMAKAPVIVWYVDSFRYRVLTRSSFALHLWKALTDATEEYK